MHKYLFFMVASALFACAPKSEQTTQAEVQSLPVSHFEKMRLAGDNIVIIDVRTPEETAEGMVPDALEIDYNGEDFEKKILELDREKTYVMYCAAGARGSKAATFMVQNGFTDVYNLDGGYEAWEEFVSK